MHGGPTIRHGTANDGEKLMNRSKKVFISASALVIASLMLQASVSAQVGPDPATTARNERIVGLWDVEVAIFNCATDAPMGGFKAMHKFELGGTGQVVPNNSPTALSAHMMIWNHVKNDDYQVAIKMFRFDVNGANIGWVVLNNQVSIDKEGNEYVGSGVAEFFDANGNFQFSSCPSLIGTRFEG
jgi:hypothetical protein